ncbi:unnamed protein product [Rodentolepis nana]|uniref:DH domain-containing protein n=1 Tax=Rodentolepis nana TaxID=102285 RepID=A0A0R3T646_RODNA|nr:unnamed protein product [Rodentolepis nana]
MNSKPLSIRGTKCHISEALADEVSDNNSSVFVASPPTNPDHLSPPPRLRTKIPNGITSERNSVSNGSSFNQRSTFKGNSIGRHRLSQVFARSTPDINMEVRQTNPKNRRPKWRRERSVDHLGPDMVQLEKLQNRLRCFENGKLPKIPPELYDYFPQNLPPHDFTAIENMWNKLTSNGTQESDCGSKGQYKNNKDQQLSAILELLHTEACYIKTLEMIINVHIAVYLDLTKSTVSNSVYNHPYSGGSLSRLGDPIFPTELASSGSFTSSVSSGTNSSTLGGMFRRMRGRGNHDYTTPTLPQASSSSSLNNLSVLTLSEHPSFSAPPVENVFGNIGSIYRANHTFWSDCFKPGIINNESLDAKLCIESMHKAFSQFKIYFEPYAHFLEAYNTLVSNIRHLDENNKFFSLYHEWTKTKNTLNSRESLSGLLAQPFQRLTRYGILIKRIRESTTDEHEIAALTEMIDAVDDFVKEVDINQPEQEARAKLNDFILRIHKYTFADTVRSDLDVEVPVLSTDIGNILRQPMKINGRTHTRKPIAEVQAKVKYIGGKVSDALCVLLSDMLLICKQSITKRHLSVYRPPIFLTHLTIQKKKDSPDCYVALIRNDYGLLVDCYVFSSEEKDLEEWVSKVLRQKADLLSAPRPISVGRDSVSGPSYLHSTVTSVPDGSSRHAENTIRSVFNDNHLGTFNGHYESRRNSEVGNPRYHHTPTDVSSTVIGRPQQLLDGPIRLIPVRARRKSILTPNRDNGDAISPCTENVSVDKTRSEACLKSLVSKSISSASDSSNTSNSTASSINTTSGDSLGCWASEAPGSMSGISPKITRHSLGRVPFRNTELLKTDAGVAKRQTS